MKYTDIDIENLKKYYHELDRPSLLKILNGHSWVSIKNKANKLGLARPNIRQAKLKILLEHNILNSYWWGLIISDGYLSNRGELVVQLGIKDKIYLSQLAKYIGVTPYYPTGFIRISAMDRINGLKLKNKLGIIVKKTYNPPNNFDFLKNKDMMLAFLIGFIDGDGCIQYRNETFSSIRIVIHHNWISFFKTFQQILLNYYPFLRLNISLNGRNNTCIYLGKKSNYQFLCNFIKIHQLPILDRKWKIYEKSS